MLVLAEADDRVTLDLKDAGCLPLSLLLGGGFVVELLVAAGESTEGVREAEVLYGGLGAFSGLRSWIWKQIISSNCFSGKKRRKREINTQPGET